MELIPEKSVSDGLWHSVSLTYSPSNIEVGLKYQSSSLTF